MAKDIVFDILARDRASSTFDKVGKSSDGLGSKLGSIGSVAAVGAKAAGAGFAALAAGAGASVAKAMDYDKTMRIVGTTLGTTGEQQKRLGALALKMGADTVFSAADAGNAMLELAKGGLTAAQIEGGALSATMTAAAAGGLDMGAAATYVGNALNTFGLKASEANAVAAALAGGANASSASIESLGMALSQVGPGAKTAGLSIQTTTGILAAFDNAGIKGSDAGTSLKTMLTRLVPSTDAARSAMAELGLKFTDAQGKFLPMTQVAQQLKDKMSGLSDEQRTTAMNTIFGSDATRAATVMMGLGAAGVEKYTAATSDLGAAQDMANAQMAGASGAWEGFKGSIETLAINIGIKLLPAFTGIVKWLTEMVNKIETKVGPVIQRFTNWFSGDLWPALKQGYETIIPGLKTAMGILSGGVDGSGMSWKKFGDIITTKVIPFVSKMISYYLPVLATNIRTGIEAVKLAWKTFEVWRDVVARVIAFIVGKFADMLGMWAAVLRGLSKVPGFGWAKDAATKMQNAADKARGVAKAVAAIPSSKSVTIKVSTKLLAPGRINVGGQSVNVGMRAAGGPIKRGRPYLVGENGPELVEPTSDGMVIPAGLTQRIQAALAGGGDGADRTAVVQLILDGRVIQQSLLKLKRSGGVELGLT